DGVVSEAVIEGSEPFHGAAFIEVLNDMDILAESGEELAGGDVPIAVKPGAFSPTGEALNFAFVTGIDKLVVHEPRGNEAGVGLGFGLEREDEFLAVPGVTNAAGIGGGIDAGPPVF